MVVANALVRLAGDLAHGLQRGGFHVKHIHAVQDGGGDAALVIGQFGELIGKAERRVVLQQAAGYAQRVVLGIGAGLVDLIHDSDRVGVFNIHQRLKHPAGLDAFPLGR